MAKRRKSRKQRVVLRSRRRQEIKSRVGGWMGRGIVIGLVLILGAGLVAQGDQIFAGFLEKHTPALEIRAPKTLAGQPVVLEWPKHRFWLWFPGVTFQAERLVMRKSLAIRSVRFERNFAANQIVAWIEPRTPIVRWNESGMDRDGVVFPILPGTWIQLPSANFGPSLSRPIAGRWLAALSSHSALWGQVAAVSDDRKGNLLTDLKTGARILWGPPEPEGLAGKINLLSQVLDDAHENLGGAASADLRFFEQGRIIVKPKTAH